MPEPVKKRGRPKGSGGRPHKKKGTQHTNSGSLAEIFDYMREQGFDPLPPDIRERCERLKARRLIIEEHS